MQANLLDYFATLSEERKAEKGNYGNWESARKHLGLYCDALTTFNDVDIQFVEGFKNFLKETKTKSGKSLSQNSQHSYYQKFAACLRHAYEKGILLHNPANSVRAPKPGEHKEIISLWMKSGL